MLTLFSSRMFWINMPHQNKNFFDQTKPSYAVTIMLRSESQNRYLKKKSDHLKTTRYEAAKKLRWESLASWKEYFEHNDLMLVIIKCFESQLHLFFLNKSQKGDNLTLTEVTKVINDDEKCPDTFNSYFNSYFYWYKWSYLSNHWKIQETFKYC